MGYHTFITIFSVYRKDCVSYDNMTSAEREEEDNIRDEIESEASDVNNFSDDNDPVMTISLRHKDWIIEVEGRGGNQEDLWRRRYLNGRHEEISPVWPSYKVVLDDKESFLAENSFVDSRTGRRIYAPLGKSLIHGTMRACDLVPRFLDAIRDTAEYEQIMLDTANNWYLSVMTAADASDSDPRWASEEMWFFNETLWDIMESYAPDGYYFGCTEGDGSDYGYWPDSRDSE